MQHVQSPQYLSEWTFITQKFKTNEFLVENILQYSVFDLSAVLFKENWSTLKK